MTAQTIFVAVAVDDSFITALMVMLCSAERHLSAGWALEVFVFGHQISETSRMRLEASLEGSRVRLRWQTLDLRGVENYWPGIRKDGDITCYYRLFLGDAIPESVERVLFLDADLLVEGDLAKLWQLPFQGYVAQAVPDAYALRNHTPRLSKIEFSECIRFTEKSLYFNAGVQLIDLRRWREERIGQRAAGFLWKYGERLQGRDQDALNCALVDRWKPLAPTWNFHVLSEHPETWEIAGVAKDEIKETWRNPAIIHFVGWKPWSRAWRPHRADRWWEVARDAGIPEVRRIRHVAVWDVLFWAPHSRLRWLMLREDWSGALRLMLSRPWTFLTYPLWRTAGRYT